MTDFQDPRTRPAGAPPRRRRRAHAPVDVIGSPAGREVLPPAPGGAPPHPHPARSVGWWRAWLPALGMSPSFRAYLFVVSILAILAFLLHNESLIRQIKEQEKRNVDLYVKLVSSMYQATDEPAVSIFEEISLNPQIDFPIIVTDHRGRVTMHRGVVLDGRVGGGWAAGLRRLWEAMPLVQRSPTRADVDISAADTTELRRRIAELDAENEPITSYTLPQVAGYLRREGGRLVITDGEQEVVQERPVPVPPDGQAPILEQLEEPLSFRVPADAFSYLHLDSRNAVVADDQGSALAWRGLDLPASEDTSAAARAAAGALLRRMGHPSDTVPFQIPALLHYHYGDSALVRRISRATFVQIGVMVLFVLVGYIGLRNIKRSEQRSIWVGMAKETAHQLGTPLSSLSGWLELIQGEVRAAQVDGVEGRAERLGRIEEMAREMGRDMLRLSQIASRFSQIGSVPELHPGDVVALVQETVAYFRRRGPQFGRHEMQVRVHGAVPPVPMNADLMGWVFENLVKNAIDAIDGRGGRIEVDVEPVPDRRAVRLTVQDNGRGIDPASAGRVFDPGFSTKKRGWGLGLAVVKRIVEEYHGGRVALVRSLPGEGTVFEVLLPLARAGAGPGA
ncbi:MAG: HAMP domain-containing sensor histidine kinase [Candidatus Latescibacterota bacterium]